MARIHFQLGSASVGDGHAIVGGRCCEARFGVGDVFTSLEGGRFGQYDDKTGVAPPIGETTVVVVNLRVDLISSYQELIESLHPGSTAGLRVRGEGLDALRRFDASPELRWSLWGETGGTS
jgi:hypothetical protein